MSVLCERAVVGFLKNRTREFRDSNDLRILDANSEALSLEALDALRYQVDT